MSPAQCIARLSKIATETIGDKSATQSNKTSDGSISSNRFPIRVLTMLISCSCSE